MSEFDLDELRATYDHPTDRSVIELIDRLEQAELNLERALRVSKFLVSSLIKESQRANEAEQDRVKLRNRLDAMRRQRDGYQNQLRKTEQQVARVREVADKGTDALLRMNIRSDGLYLSQAIIRTLDGEPNE